MIQQSLCYKCLVRLKYFYHESFLYRIYESFRVRAAAIFQQSFVSKITEFREPEITFLLEGSLVFEVIGCIIKSFKKGAVQSKILLWLSFDSR